MGMPQFYHNSLDHGNIQEMQLVLGNEPGKMEVKH
jgi:hypothetical protein